MPPIPRSTPEIVETSLTGLGLLNTPIFNKGTAFTEEERDEFSLHGLLPPQIGTLDQQVARRLKAFRSQPDAFSKYTFMRDLQDVNETLFYALITRNVEEMLPVVYTPAVGEGCQRFSEIWRKPRGVFLSYPNQDRIERILNHPRYDGVRCIVVSDGERILGLGDQGAGGMGIPIGKLALYTALAGIHPLSCLPVFLDVGTDNEERRNDPLYLGWKHERVRGPEYDNFVDRFVRAVKKRWPHVLLQWEDFAGANAGKLLEKYRNQLPSFNDDIQGTAAVALSTVLAAANATGMPLREHRFLFVGFGAAGCGIASFLELALKHAGLSDEEARSRFYAIDRPGLLMDSTPGMHPSQQPFARKASETESWQHMPDGGVSLLETVERVRPTVMIGVSGQPGAFSEEVVRAMAKHVERPVILPLSNPTSRAEATPHDLIHWTDGKAIIGTGSPYAPVEYNGQTYRTVQTNNSYIFPGLALGIVAARARRVSDGMIMAAAEALAAMSPTVKNASAPLLPPLDTLREVSWNVAVAVAREAEKEGLTALRGADLEASLHATIWEPVYLPFKRRRG
ncbi:NAD-dependent malic enzyme [Granulicella cerasi]|uniref:NAD-dependent malic enzyme n=1 Tax=Granulicella cerasi TaxID=741063 RepID=A0ABW1ZDT7_9BACT|nr:NAD-dependent malic enzyme [Granulicella cerasi]